MGIGILLMYLLRTINYSNKKINISTKLDYLPVGENNQLILISNNHPYSFEELLIQNNKDIGAVKIVNASKNIQAISEYFYSGEKNISAAILERFSKDFSIIANTNIKLKNIQFPYVLEVKTTKSSKQSNVFILFRDACLIKNKILEFNKEASLLRWNILFSEAKYIKI